MRQCSALRVGVILPGAEKGSQSGRISPARHRVVAFVNLSDLLARQDGLELPSMEEQREQIVLPVEDAIRKPEALPLQASDTLARVLEIAEAPPQEILLVRFPTGRWASVSCEDLRKLAFDHSKEVLLGEILPTARLPVFHPDQRLDDVLRYVQDYVILPVVSPAGHECWRESFA